MTQNSDSRTPNSQSANTSFVNPPCPICNKPVPIEIATTDENGKMMHEECYMLKVKRETGPANPE